MLNNKSLDVEESLTKMIRHMQIVEECRVELNNLQGIWDNLTLLGQLSGTGTDMNGTRQSFQKLTGSLLNQLANETLRKCVLEMTSKAQVAIDILVRNLFERTADIGFLATDEDIIAVAKSAKLLEKKFSRMHDLEVSLVKLKERFFEYYSKYSVYSDIVLLDTEGKILVRLNDKNTVEQTQHSLVKRSLETTDGYLETFDTIDFLPDESTSLVYSYRVLDEENIAIGVLCLCFRFENELAGIFNNLVAEDDWSVITLLNEAGHVIASSDIDHIALQVKLSPVLDKEFRIQRFAGQEYLACTRTSHNYQGYAGPKWYAHVMLPLQHAFNRDASGILNTIPQQRLNTVMEHSQLFGESLRNIPQQAELIQRELNRSVWNGNVKQYHHQDGKDAGFSKILLWEISNTGAKTQSVFQQSIANLHETVVTSVLEDSRFQASLAIDIMDRNLYERANDCRWWALTSSFREILAEAEVSATGKQRISSILTYINNLYTVYTNLFVFDKYGRILAVSNVNESHLVGQNVAEDWHKRVLMIGDSQGYAVSDFTVTRFYNNQPTYIYGAAITDAHENKVLGGIGIVFDATPQFSAMLQDALPKNADGQIDSSSFAVFVNQEGRVIACSDDRYKPGENLPVSSYLLHLKSGENLMDVIALQGEYYAIGAYASKGYREYKSESDAYKNTVIALVGKQLCAINENPDKVQEVPRPTIHSDRGNKGDNVEIATFRLGKEWFGIRANQILEAVDPNNITPAPGAGAECEGYLVYDQIPIPVFDIRTAVCATENQALCSDRNSQQVIVIQYDPSTRFGIISDALGEIPEIELSRMNKLPPMLSGGSLLADTAIAPDNAADEFLLLVLNIDRLAEKLASGMKLSRMTN
ncbi:chemotaxis protein CheW [Methylomonas sp. AM2-LC]|uniref:chemotaxis protein CheW n=1 Tax=Methylomonas sp. AM2-LC TaxID=3153301 RepID=UPI0032632801